MADNLETNTSKKFSVIDLFAGAGGLSLGAARAGFDLKLAVETDPHALSTHKLNFPNCVHLDRDISKLKGTEILSKIELNIGELTGIIGGPPCQGFSVIGRHEETDGRNALFSHFFRLVDEIRPSFFVAENVPGILNSKYDKLRKSAFEQVESNYTILDPFFVKASDYGAPTVRKRVFFVGFNPTKFTENLFANDFLPSDDTEKIYVKEALAGLPEYISPDWQKEEDGWKIVAKTNGSRFMKKVVEEIPNGIGDEIAVKRFSENSEVSGCLGTKHSSQLEMRYKNLENGKQDKISKSLKLDPNGLCPTLRAGTGSDKGSYQAVRPIHYNEPRVITPREAARLQGFPDWFIFHPTKWHSFRQIGNSVSPIVAEYLLKIIFNNLNRQSASVS